MKLRVLFIFLLLCQSYLAFSETIIITSNADSGPGTLRQALTDAAANGNAEIDQIRFNLPGVSPADRTIKILSALPVITTDIVIDASTQSGQDVSVNGAKVIIDGSSFVFNANQHNFLFNAKDVNSFELYGLVIMGFEEIGRNEFGGMAFIATLLFEGNNKKVTIGSPGKGNVIYNTYGISLPYDQAGGKSQIQELILKSNFFGIKENGIDIATRVITELNLRSVYKATVGGLTAVEGNLIYGSMQFDFEKPGVLLAQNIAVVVRNNIFTANAEGDRPGVTVAKNTIYHSFGLDANLNHSPNIDIEIADNVFGAGLTFSGLDNANVLIRRNFFGTSRDGTKSLPIQDEAIRILYFNGRVLIGGSSTSEGNVITNTSAFPTYQTSRHAITAEKSEKIELSHNSLYCNPGIPFLYSNTGPFAKVIEVLLKEKTASYVAGKTKPGARVELYYSDPECTNCQPKRYFAAVTANAQGDWRYDGAIEAGFSVLASATLNQITSEFSDPRIYMFPYNEPLFKVTNQTCEDQKGKIEGAFTVNVDKVEWVNELGEVVGTGLNIEGLLPGKYRLRANQFGCIIYSEWVVIENNMPQLSFSGLPTLVHPSCGNGGSILNLYPNYFTKLQWLDKDGNERGTARELTNVSAGTYTLRLTGLTGCVKDFGPYILTNVTGPTIDQSAPLVQNSNCNASTGSIKNILVSGSGTLSYKWTNADGVQVGTDVDLINVQAGQYKLEVRDASSCPPFVSNPIDVFEVNGININIGNLSIAKATCNTDNGGITGIIVTGATSYSWVNSSDALVSNTADLTNMPAGKYRLIASNAFCSKTTEEFTIELAQSTLDYSSTKITSSATCGLNNGKIEAIFTKDQPAACFWKNSIGETVGHSRILENQGPGVYDLYVIDNLGCERLVQHYSISNASVVVINRVVEIVINDQCGMQKGSIKAPALSGGVPPYYYQWKNEDGNVIGSSAILDGLKAGSYELTIGDAVACSRQVFSYTVQNESMLITTPVVNDVKICSPGNAVIQVMNPAEGTYTIYDENGLMVDRNKTGVFNCNVKQTQVYTVLFQQGSCAAPPAAVKVTIENGGIGALPNAFSPNGDGVNDLWLISGISSYPQASIAIFNRYGVKVFESTGYHAPFNGRRNGSELPVGTYYYIIDLKRGCGLQKGSLTLLR